MSMKVTNKLIYKLTIYFLLVGIVFSSLAPTRSLAREVENSEPVSSREFTAEPAEVLALPMPEEVKPTPLLVEEPIEVAPIESDLSELEIPVETLDVNTEDPAPYIQRDEIKSLTDKLNIEADSNSGAFVYGYPIEVPAGRNGLQPDLQLTYNSQNNDNQNLFGYGWSISIPYIGRLNKTGIDKLYTDNYFTSSLTGELVAIDANGNYASKVENGEFFDYQYDDVNNNWTARDKQGNVYTFGATVASRQDNPNDTTKIFKWLLEEVRDTNDNFIRYEYYKDAGQIYPYKVFYTGSGSTDGIYEVEFLRESRSDNLKSFATGFNVSNNYRIYEIDIKIDNQWENKYHLNYVVGDNNTRSLLDNIVEGARDPNSGVMMIMPEDSFNYTNPEKTWTLSNYSYPTNCYGASGEYVTIVDLNGDSLSDFLCFISTGSNDEDDFVIYLNNGDGTWEEHINPNAPISLSETWLSKRFQIADFNGDGLNDFISEYAGMNPGVYINDGNLNWIREGSYGSISPSDIYYAMYIDVNNDNMADKIYAYANSIGGEWKEVDINNGNSFVRDYNYNIEFLIANAGPNATPIDINGDGFVDFIYYDDVYINRADGTGWYIDPSYEALEMWHNYGGYRLVGKIMDINGDGLQDIVRRDLYHLYDGVYINNGNGTWTEDNTYTIPVTISSKYDYADRYTALDIDGNGTTDWIETMLGRIYLSDLNNKSDVINIINTSASSQININYQSSAQATSTSGLLNPELPFVVPTVKQITIDDGLGNESVIDYKYSDGQFYYDINNPYDKKFTGFGQVEKTVNDTKSITYYHQANESNSSQGEYNDSYYKIGKPYRQEAYDNNTDELLNQTIYKWEETDLGHGNKFTYNTQKSDTSFVGATKSTASQMQYNISNGNLLTENNLGEVVVNTGTGEITNQLIGDEKDTDYDYAQNTVEHILAAPKTKVISDSTDSKQQDLYYDNLPLGQIDKVNLTKEDYIEQDVEVNRKFNSYGLVYEQSDPNFATTTIAYDSNILYPISSTDPLNNITYTDYNLLNGQVATSTAPNGAITVNSFDAFGRLIATKISDPDNANNLVVKQEIIYYDGEATPVEDSGWVYPTTHSYYSGNGFINPANAYVSDNNYSYHTGFGQSQSYEGFNFSIPANSTIIGLDVSVEHNVSSLVGVNSESIRYYSASNNIWSSDLSLTNNINDHVDIVSAYSQSDQNFPTLEDFNNGDFSLFFRVQTNGVDARTWNLDEIKVKVYYKEPVTLSDLRHKETRDYFDINSYTTSREYYDGLDRVIQTKMQTAVANEYATVDISYDSQGRMNRQSLPYITSSISYSAPNLSQPAKTYTYDALGRVLTETTPVGTTSYEYNGFTTKITDANGNFKELTKDAYGNLVAVKEYNGNEIYTTSYEYTLTNKLKKITDSAGNIRNFSYDALDNLEWQDMVHKPSVTTPAKINYSHDKNGNVLTETSFKGDNISYVYDDLNRVLFEKLAGANQITYTYDQNNDIGQLSLADYGNNNRKAYDYDILGNLRTATTTIEGEDFVMHFDYDLNGNVKSIVYPNNWLVSYGFNNIGQVNSVSLDKGTGPIVLTDNIEYNQNGQMTHLERSNGVVTDYTYDPSANFRLANLASTVATSTLQNISYAYDAVGNITQITDNSSTNLAKTAWYDYDDLYRLASSTVNYLTHPADNYSKTYDYDAIGNMTYNSDLGVMNYANGQPHQLSSFTGRTFTYDAAGNTKTNNINKFSWDWRNRLKSSYDIASENSTYYQYDHNNQRFIKYTEELVFIPPDPQEAMAMASMTSKEEGLDAASGGTYELQRVKEHKYIDSYFEKDIADNSKSHINLNSTKIATVNNNDNPYFILGDHLGSSSLLTDSTGTVAEMTDYLPYGKINYESTTQDLGDDYKHTGKELDEENALQYFGARYMDNEVGRFTSVDPLLSDLQNSEKYNKKVVELLSDPQQVNSYSYTRNNPIVYTDPTGNAVETPFDLVMLALSAQAYYSNPTAGNVVWLGLDVLGTLAPGVPAASYFRFSHKAHQIIKYFDEVAEIANKKTVDIISTFVKNVAFKFNRRAWSIGEAGNDVASLTGHFAKWGDSVGAKNVGDYYNKANDFIESKQYTQAFKEGRDTVYYNRNNKYVAITGSKGEIKSYHLETNPNKLSNYEARIKKGNYE